MLSHLSYSPIISYMQDVAKRAANARSFIWYNMDGFTKSTDGTISLTNKGAAGSRLNAEAFASKHIYLNNQSVPYPILHTLGSETSTTLSSSSSWITVSTDNIICGGAGGAEWDDAWFDFNTTETWSTGDKVFITFDAVVNSGTFYITGYYDGANPIELNPHYLVVNGANKLEVSSRAGDDRVSFFTFGNTLFNADLTNRSVKQITLPSASYLSRFSSTLSTLTELSSTGDRGATLPVSTTYSVTDSHQFVFNHTAPLEDIDVSALEADPNLAFRMFFDDEVLPSGFSNTDVGWFSGGNEGLASAEKVYDLSDQAFLTYVSIVDYDAATRTTLANQSNGASNLKLIRNVSGGTTGTAAVNTTQWEADGRTAVTNWTITAPFTITEDIDGDIYTFTSAGNRYKNTVADGTYTLPTGIWTLDEFGFDGVTSVTARGTTKMVNEIVIP